MDELYLLQGCKHAFDFAESAGNPIAYAPPNRCQNKRKASSASFQIRRELNFFLEKLRK